MNKTLVIGLFLIGVGLVAAAVVWLGAGKIFHAIGAIGYIGMAEVIGWQLIVFIVLGVAWRVILSDVPLWLVIWGRLVREAGENCLPFSEVGGLVFGTRAVMLGGLKLSLGAASSIVDVMAEGMGMVPFMVLGLFVLATRARHSSLIWPMAAALVALIAGAVALYFMRGRLAKLLRWGGARLLKPWTKDAPHQAEEMQKEVETLFSRRTRIAGGAAVHFIAWCGGGGNVWIAYRLLGAHVSAIDAIAIEALLSSVLAVAFLVPGAVGVQEFSYMAIGSAFGVPVHLSLALSLIRRARDILIGAPALLVWQGIEARQLRRKH